MKKNFSSRVSALIMGFASGVMIAAGFLGLLIPSIESASESYGDYSVFPVVIGFLLGGVLLFALDKLIPHIHINNNEEEGTKTSKITRQLKFFLAVTIHNIPEGLAVGFALGLAYFKRHVCILCSFIIIDRYDTSKYSRGSSDFCSNVKRRNF